jgi:hypothetical protein
MFLGGKGRTSGVLRARGAFLLRLRAKTLSLGGKEFEIDMAKRCDQEETTFNLLLSNRQVGLHVSWKLYM